MPTILNNLKINTLGSVDKAANGHALVSLMKRATEAPPAVIEEKGKQGGNDMPMTDEEKKAAEKAMADTIAAEVAKRMPDIEAIQKRNTELEAQFAKSELDRVTAETILKAERDEVKKSEFIAKAGLYKNLPVKAADFGLVLKGLSEKAPEEYAQIEALLKAADEAISKGGVFKEEGTGSKGTDGGTAVEQLNALAKSYIEKGEKGLTNAQAFLKALEENPALYIQYEKEQNEGRE